MSNSSWMPVLAVWVLSVTLIPHVAGQSHDGRCSDPTPECVEALHFFQKFQLAIKADDRNEVASLVRYPLRVMLKATKL